MTRYRPIRPSRLTIGVSAAALALSLAGCGGDDDAASDVPAAPAETQAGPAAPDGAHESDAPEGPADEDHGADDGAGSDSGQTGLEGSAQIPDDFPSGIPLPEPVPISARSNIVVGQQQWSFQYDLSGLPETEAYFADLEAAGYPEVDAFDLSETQLNRTFADDLYEVTVGTTGNGERLTVLITVWDQSS